MDNDSSAYTISHQPLRKTVADRLRSLILSGELPPGQHLIETDLAAKMGVSRGPIREAIAKLEHEGFVQIVPRQGAFVLEITPESIHERYEMRRLLEVYAARRAAESPDPQHLRALEVWARETERSIRERDLEAFYVSQYQYHRQIVQMAEMPLLLRLWDLLASGLGSLMMLNLWYANPGEAFSERVWGSGAATGSVHGHMALLKVIARGDVEAAAQTLWAHLEQGERAVLAALESARALSEGACDAPSPVAPDSARA